MSARRFRKAWWVDFSYKGHRTRVRSPDNSKAGAVAYEALLRQRLARGESIRTEKRNALNFKEFAREWTENYVEANNKDSEKRSKRVILGKHLVPFFGSMNIREIGSADIERYKASKFAIELHKKTINNHLTVLRRCLRSAQEWGLLEQIPIIKLLRTSLPEARFLSEEDEHTLLATVKDPFAYRMFLTALHTGMRMGELIGLDWSAVDFTRGTICVRQSIVRGVLGTPKSNKMRFIPLTDLLLKTLYKERKKGGLVFSREDGLPLSDSILKKMIWKACDDAAMERFGWHRLRHTFASRLVSRGVSLRAVQQLLGHASIVMTERYVHLAPTMLTEAIRVLEKGGNQMGKATDGQHIISFELLQKNSQEENHHDYSLK